MKNFTRLTALFNHRPTITKVLFTLFITLGACMLHGQNFEWAKRMGGTGADNGQSVTFDASGNVYTTGGFEGAVDFDPGPGEYILISAGSSDIFISKVNASGTLVWVRQIGGDKADYGNSITLDGNGNVLTTGYFRDTVDFDPGAGTFILSIEELYYGPTGTPYIKGSDLFVSKLDTDGNFIWAKQIGGNLSDFGTGIAVDGANNVFTTGEYAVHYTTDSCDFDPGPGIFNLGEGGGFISKLDASGNFVWAKRFGVHYSSSSGCGPATCIFYKDYTVEFRAVALDGSGNVYTSGSFIQTNDFDPGPGTFSLTCLGTRDAFVCKLDNAGNFAWAKQMGGSSATAQAEDIAVDASGNVHTTGYFTGKVDFNPGATTFNLTSSPAGNLDIFISKLNTSGAFTWAKQIGGSTEDKGSSIALDGQGNVYTTGWFSAKADFDPGTAKYFLTPAGNDVFISKLTGTGVFAWARKVGGPGDDKGYGIAVDASSNVLTSGYFSGTADFDPNAGTYNLTSSGGSDVFVLKLNQSPPPAFASDEIYFAEAGISLFPNPAHEKVTYSFIAEEASDYTISLFDMSGRLLKKYQGTSYKGYNEQDLHFDNIAQGIYQVIFIMNEKPEMKLLLVE